MKNHGAALKFNVHRASGIKLVKWLCTEIVVTFDPVDKLSSHMLNERTILKLTKYIFKSEKKIVRFCLIF